MIEQTRAVGSQQSFGELACSFRHAAIGHPPDRFDERVYVFTCTQPVFADSLRASIKRRRRNVDQKWLVGKWRLGAPCVGLRSESLITCCQTLVALCIRDLETK